MSEWKEVRLEDITSVLGDGIHGTPVYSTEGDYYFINGSNLYEGEIILKQDTKRVSEKEYQKYRKDLNDRTLLFSINGTVGNVAKYNGEPCILGKSACYFNIIDTVDKNFIYYVVSSPSFIKEMSNLANGTTIKNVSLKQMRDKKFLLPPLNEQQKIAAVLSSLDDKIAVNRKINENLEQQAQALFKSWFVDFEPFKDGEFEESELGRIPKGWKVGTLGEQCKCLLGGTPSRNKAEYWNGDIAWINSGEVNRFRITSPTEYITELGLKNSATKLLPQKTTVLAITGATLGQVSLLEIDSCANQSVIGVLENNNFPYVFIYPLIKNNIIELMAHMTGGAQQHINKNNVESLRFIIPPSAIMNKYKELTSSIYGKISNSCMEINTLSQLRDTLLPKLMSGELKVNEI